MIKANKAKALDLLLQFLVADDQQEYLVLADEGHTTKIDFEKLEMANMVGRQLFNLFK